MCRFAEAAVPFELSIMNRSQVQDVIVEFRGSLPIGTTANLRWSGAVGLETSVRIVLRQQKAR